ncbi:MAG: cupredoxin domain-containing protein, partial [Coriobacteriia bacterium]|nr:cupredoxin domain-containing protein [Coriobacteriia bacterium]
PKDGRSVASSKKGKKSARRRPAAAAARLSASQKRWIVLAFGVLAAIVVAAGIWQTSAPTRAADGSQAPEAEAVLAVQSSTPFQIMIPGYLPAEFVREDVEIVRDDSGPSGEPLVELTYRTKESDGPVVYIREWVPGNPELESLAGSRPIETKWGKGWLLQYPALNAIWADVGATRVSVFSRNVDEVTKEHLLAMAESLGPATNKQVFTYVVDRPIVKEIEPPAPFEPPIGEDGFQEATLVITPGGYDPLRMAVKKDVPVRIRFRQLGEVGCGSELIFPSDPENLASLQLDSPTDEQVLEFTPDEAGEFQYFCGHRMYRGLFIVKE